MLYLWCWQMIREKQLAILNWESKYFTVDIYRWKNVFLTRWGATSEFLALSRCKKMCHDVYYERVVVEKLQLDLSYMPFHHKNMLQWRNWDFGIFLKFIVAQLPNIFECGNALGNIPSLLCHSASIFGVSVLHQPKTFSYFSLMVSSCDITNDLSAISRRNSNFSCHPLSHIHHYGWCFSYIIPIEHNNIPDHALWPSLVKQTTLVFWLVGPGYAHTLNMYWLLYDCNTLYE